MTRYFYKIVGSDNWYILDKGYIEAEDRQQAKEKILDLLDLPDIPQRRTAKLFEKIPFVMFLDVADEHYYRRFKEVHTCKRCGEEFTEEQLTKSYTDWNDRVYCSSKCQQLDKMDLMEKNGIEYHWDCERTDYETTAVIYRIYNKIEDKSYIGQTRQSFTLRWWQHIKSATGTKFNRAFLDSNLTDWTFEVVEDFKKIGKKELDEKETFYIKKFNSIENGYNSTKILDEEDKQLIEEEKKKSKEEKQKLKNPEGGLLKLMEGN
jgi:hypothetical protein